MSEQPNGHVDVNDEGEAAKAISSVSKPPPDLNEDVDQHGTVQMQKASESMAGERATPAEQEDKESEQEGVAGKTDPNTEIAINGGLTSEKAEARWACIPVIGQSNFLTRVLVKVCWSGLQRYLRSAHSCREASP